MQVLIARGVPESSRLIPTVVITLVLTLLSYRWFEQPFLRLKDRFETQGQMGLVPTVGD